VQCVSVVGKWKPAFGRALGVCTVWSTCRVYRLWVLSVSRAGISSRHHVSTCNPRPPDLGLETGRGREAGDMAWRVERAIRGLRAICV